MVAQMSGITMPHAWGYPLLGVCAIMGLAGLWLAFAPQRAAYKAAYKEEEGLGYRFDAALHGLVGCSTLMLLVAAAIFGLWLYGVTHP
jgi:hypothetical protein